jgi:hypothetical protein
MSHGDVSTLDAFFGSPRVAAGCNVHGVVDHGNVSSPSVALFVRIDNTFDRNSLSEGFGSTLKRVAASTIEIPTRRLIHKKDLAEREGFEPPVRFPVHLISSLVGVGAYRQTPAITNRKRAPLSLLFCS